MNYDWTYLCCHEKFLEMTLRHLPREPLDGLRTVHVCYQGHQFPDLGHRLKLQCIQDAPDWLEWEVSDVSHATWQLACFLGIRFTPFQHYYMNEKHNIALGAKMMMPLMFAPPILFTDDDVLVLQDPKRLLTGPFCTAHGFNRLGMTIPGVRIANNLRDVFDAERDFSVYDYNEHAVDAGVWFVQDATGWDRLLARFWHSPYVQVMKTDNTEFRCCDQRFLTMYGRKYGWRRLTSTRDRRIYLTALDERVKVKFDAPFVHYGASSHKDEYIAHFRERLRCGQ